jgi:hypothetical protein
MYRADPKVFKYHLFANCVIFHVFFLFQVLQSIREVKTMSIKRSAKSKKSTKRLKKASLLTLDVGQLLKELIEDRPNRTEKILLPVVPITRA